MELHPRSDPTGYVGAHEVGHHLGLVDEYHDPVISPGRRVYNDNAIMTDYDLRLGPPNLPERNIQQIKHAIERRIRERIRDQQQEAQGGLPI